ncbi:MAG: hypothetical protein ACREVH_12725 [Gammaproteobacteria bacterium]
MYSPIIKSQYHSGAATALVVALLSHPLGARAIDLGFGDWQAHGFLSQGYTYTSGNDFFGNSQGDGSLEFTELGMNVLGHPFPNLLLAVQGIYRDTGGSDEEDFRLDYANLDYHLDFGDATTAGVRLGRVKNPIALYNETRDAIWTRPGVTLPQSIYFDAAGFRAPEIASDGGILYGRYRFGEHALSAEFLVAEPLDNIGGAPAFLAGPNTQGTLGGRPLYIGRAGYEWREGRVRLLFSAVDLDRDFESSSPSMPSGNIKAFAPFVSAQVNLESWSFTSEYERISLKRTGLFPPPSPKFLRENTTESYYFQAEYRFMPRWSALARYDVFYGNADDHDGSAMARVTGLPRYRFFAKDLTFGLRWEFASDWLIAAEYHNVHGTGWLSPVDNPQLDSDGGDGHWDLLAVMLSYRF